VLGFMDIEPWIQLKKRIDRLKNMPESPSTKLSVCTTVICCTLTEEIVSFVDSGISMFFNKVAFTLNAFLSTENVAS